MTTPNDAGRPDPGGRPTTFDVRIWGIKVINGRRVTYQVRWKVAGRSRENTKNFTTLPLAKGRQAELLAATKKGEAFDVELGIPVSELRDAQPSPVPVRTWLEHARDFIDMKWPALAPKSRRSAAEALATVTPALLVSPPPQELDELVREALYGWLFVSGRRRTISAGGTPTENPPPEGLIRVLDWLESHTLPLTDLSNPTIARACMDLIARRLDGKPAGANTIARKRAVFYGCLEYAVERRELPANPLGNLSWKTPKVADQVDRRAVVNHRQARTLLETGVRPQDPRLVAFFGSMYYAAMRPGEVHEVNANYLTLPKTDAEWGELTLATSNPDVPGEWADDGERGARQLKHRAAEDTRPIPIPPDLVALYRWHISTFGTADDGRLFRGTRGGPVPSARYGEVWREARRLALAPGEVTSPLAGTPYDLRHAAVSTWLNAGVPPTQIAEWAGHSVSVLLHVYAKCIVGQDAAARLRIEAALRLDDAPADP